jgi:hypothetical protein
VIVRKNSISFLFSPIHHHPPALSLLRCLPQSLISLLMKTRITPTPGRLSALTLTTKATSKPACLGWAKGRLARHLTQRNNVLQHPGMSCNLLISPLPIVSQYWFTTQITPSSTGLLLLIHIHIRSSPLSQPMTIMISQSITLVLL